MNEWHKQAAVEDVKVTALTATQRPIRLAGSGKRDVRTQFGALPWRLRDGKVQIMLVTSRGTGRWIIPKGWPMDGETPAQAAATEALEEGGVEGKISLHVLGFYGYRKTLEKGDALPIIVAVFPLKVKRILKDWPEKKERKRRWVSQKKAAALLTEPELRHIVQNFNPRLLRP